MKNKGAWPARPRLALIPLAAAAALLSGCMSLAPKYERPAAPVATSYPDTTPDDSRDALRASAIDWRRFFADARMQRLIELALQNNRDLRVAVLNIEQARAQHRVTRADLLPTVGVGISSQRQPGPTGNLTNTYLAGVFVSSYELDLFGRVRSLSNADLARYFATEEARKAAQISLIGSVAGAELALRADDELLRIAEDTLRTREESLKLTQLRFDNGVASELDVRQSQSLIEGARAAVAQTRRQRAQDLNALTLLVGQPLPPDLPAAPSINETVMSPDVPAGLPSELLTQRPDIRQAEQQLIAANANIGAARAAFFPSITLTASAGSGSSHLADLFKSGSFAWTMTSQALLTVFDSGRNQANLDSARAGRDIAIAQYEKAIQSAFREVADALAGRATLGEQMRAQQAQALADEASFNLSDLRYRNGVASYLDLLDAQRSLFATRQAVVQTKLLSLQNQVTLYQTLGGGWTEPVDGQGGEKMSSR
jgi:NodT family efflux transporter outer membrane factor (OMF) lipoprotein